MDYFASISLKCPASVAQYLQPKIYFMQILKFKLKSICQIIECRFDNSQVYKNIADLHCFDRLSVHD